MAKETNSWTTGFQRATIETYTRHRLIGLSVGEVGSRKTSFWLEGPAPIVVLGMDNGLEGVVDRILRDIDPNKEVYVKEYEWLPTTDTSQEEAIAIRDQFTAAFETAVQNARTVIVDKETDVWEMFRYAEFGSPNDAPRNYPALNQRFRRLVNMVKATDCNVGFIESMKDEWVKSVNKKTGAQGAVGSGNRIRAGFGELDGLVHQVLYHSGVSPDTWKVEVGKARGEAGSDVAGTDLGNVTFQEFAQLLFPSSDESEWV